MKQVTQRLKDGIVHVAEVPPPGLTAHGVLVTNAYSLISAGTERTKIELGQSSLVEKARRRPDDVKRVLDRVRRDGLLSTYKTVQQRLEARAPLGYSSAGVVDSVGELVEGIRPGDRVACGGAGYANHAEVVYVPQNLCVPVPEGVELSQAAYATVGSIAMHGMRLAEIGLGDRVAVIGLGLLGQLACQIARAAGAVVLGLDVDPGRAELARAHGATATAVVGKDDVGAAAAAVSGGMGVDAVVITAGTSSSDPVIMAGEIARDRGTVVVVGDVGMDVPRALYYGKELTLRVSRSYGPGRYDVSYEEYGIDYPPGHVRWTERRNMAEFLALVASGAVRLDDVTTHVLPVDRAAEAFALVMGEGDGAPLGVLLEYEASEDRRAPVDVAPRSSKPEGTVGVGFVGAGNFATGTLLPALTAAGGVALRGVATAGGLSATDAAERYGFSFAAADPGEVIGDDDTDAVVVATRHSSHAEYVRAALEAGTHVFVEKPLALTRDEVDGVVEAWAAASGIVAVGFNRRYSPLTRRLLEHLDAVSGPRSIAIRVNAGALPPDHWTQQVEAGGGRIVGEVCHFIDLAQCLAGSRPTRVHATGAGNGKSAALQDSLVATVAFDDGSLASVVYTADGDTSYPKERVEVFCGGGVGVIDDFRSLSLVKGGREDTTSLTHTDKGHKAEMAAFVAAVRGTPDPVLTFGDVLASTLATLAVVESLGTGSAVEVVVPDLAPRT